MVGFLSEDKMIIGFLVSLFSWFSLCNTKEIQADCKIVDKIHVNGFTTNWLNKKKWFNWSETSSRVLSFGLGLRSLFSPAGLLFAVKLTNPFGK